MPIDQASHSLLGRAIGRQLAAAKGLAAAYLPLDVPLDVARAIVDEANLCHPVHADEPPFALLCTPQGETDGSVSPGGAIKYRFGDRLVVLYGQHPDMASFVQTFVEHIGPDFPEHSSPLVSLDELASAAVEIVLDEAGVPKDMRFDCAPAAEELLGSFKLLRDVYSETDLGTALWNGYWFTHVDLGLEGIVRYLKSSRRPVPEALERAARGAMTLPGVGSVRHKAFDDAVVEHWADRDSVRTSAKQIQARSANQLLGWLANESWVDDLDNQTTILGRDHPHLALHSLGLAKDPVAHVDTFASMQMAEFLEPSGSSHAEMKIQLASSDGPDLSRVGRFSTVTFIGMHPTDGTYQSDLLAVDLPLVMPTTVDTAPELEFSNRSLSWTGTGRFEVSPDHVRVYGQISCRDFNAKRKAVATPKAQTPLKSALASGKSTVFPIPLDKPAVVTCHAKGRDSTTLPTLHVRPDGGSDERVPVSIDRAGTVVTLATGPANTAPTIDGQAMTPWAPGLFFESFNPDSVHELGIGEVVFSFEGRQDGEEGRSPLEAAITNSKVLGTPPASSDVRGWYEEMIGRNVSDKNWARANWHVALSATSPEHSDVSLLPTSGLLHPSGTHDSWTGKAFSVPEELITSPGAERFRLAAERLNLGERLMTSSEDVWRWPSMASWRDLSSADVEEYLLAYRELLAAARRNDDPSGIFWASYPFSVSIWRHKPSHSCKAVLLSPLHPIRLAWLSEMEGLLWDAPEQQARALAGVIEGWNIPLLAPGSDYGERMMAVPIDAGESGALVGWSELVSVHQGTPEEISVPEILGMKVPGASSSGLNGTSTRSALRAYARLNPHVTTLTVDLAAHASAPRLKEIDDAVVEAVRDWQSDSALPGGVRVADSTRRRGPIPVEAVERRLLNSGAIPITWQRYSTDDSGPSNIRLLQEAGVRISIATPQGGSSQKDSAVLGAVPVRRFEGPTGRVENKTHKSYPGLTTPANPFQLAVAEIEDQTGGALMRARLTDGPIVNNQSDWTVTGESLLSPAALSTLVAASSGNKQMLWEWRPPLLQSSSGNETALQRRPYVAIVRIPRGFHSSLNNLVSKCAGLDKEQTAATTDDILATLGSRGVGLSSLVSIGGTHASGALGFFLTFKLLEHTTNQHSDVLVLPMDACDSFLRVLAGDDPTHEDHSKSRADLLAMVTTTDSVTLLPIEIKFYGADSQAAPGSLASADVKEAIKQASTSTELLRRIKQRHADLAEDPGSAESILWHAAMTSLVETAYKLRPSESDPERIIPLLQNLTDGHYDLDVAAALVTYFKREATGHPVTGSTGDDAPDVGVLRAETGYAFANYEQPESDLIATWQALVDWALPQRLSGPRRAMDPELEEGFPSDVESHPMADINVDDDADPHHRGPTTPDTETTEAMPVSSEPRMGPTGTESVARTLELDELKGEQASGLQSIQNDGVKFAVGSQLLTLSHEPAFYWPSNTDLTQLNMGVVGDLGTGKTQLMKSLIYQVRHEAKLSQPSPVSMLVLDYKRDYSDPEFVESVGGIVLEPHRIPLTIFPPDGGSVHQQAQQFIDIISKIFEGIGPIQRLTLSKAIQQAFQASATPTMGDVFSAYEDLVDKPDSVLATLYNFVAGEIFSEDRDQIVSFDELLRDRVVVVNLSALGTDQQTKNALVALLLNRYYQYMLGQTKHPFQGSDPQLRRLNSYLVVDEATNIMRYNFQMLSDLLAQGREFGVGVVLSSQYLSHFRTTQTNYAEFLRTWFLHGVPNMKPKDLELLGISGDTPAIAARVSAQEKFHCYYRSLGVDGSFIRTRPYFELDRGDS